MLLLLTHCFCVVPLVTVVLAVQLDFGNINLTSALTLSPLLDWKAATSVMAAMGPIQIGVSAEVDHSPAQGGPGQPQDSKQKIGVSLGFQV